MVFCYLLYYSASVHGARHQANNQILDTKSIKNGSALKEKLSEYGEGILLPLNSGPNGNFLVTVGFGTPAHDITLLFDTGSDITWIKCQPFGGDTGNNTDCNSHTIFDPSSSSTFSNDLSCIPNCNSSGNYNDNTSFTGYFATDTLTIISDQIPNFIFVCAQKISGDFEGASGLLAFGRGKNSLLAQTDLNLLSMFCYCLPISETSSGYIVFGVQAFETCQPEITKFIPIEPASSQIGLTGYYIPVIGITIGGKRLEIASYVPSNSSSVRAIIDSGTVISRLPPSLYSALRSAFQEIMSGYPRTSPSEPDSGLLDTCYNLDGHINDWRPPNIVLHLGGYDKPVDIDLHSSAAAISGKNDSEVCLAFVGNKNDNDLFIIGNKQHRARDIFFDINNKILYFSSSGCLASN
ncbi:aspartyl protease AED1-like [Euphorbia lathyris]|uniref:aspartyl protease AED1-like n=1 Tax=Euphorbia lathyris TaxID=212925 RepID=UPI00331347AC